MKSSFHFFKTTGLGGLLFLVPIVVLILIIGKAFEIAKKFTVPLATALPFNPAADIAVASLLAIAAIVLVCFLAGLLAKKRFAKKFVSWLENNILMKFPPYIFIKNTSQSMTGLEKAEGMKPVLAQFDDAGQIAFEIERIEGGHVVVYIPGSPNPWSGDVCIMTKDRIKPLEISMAKALQCLRHVGRGSSKYLCT